MKVKHILYRNINDLNKEELEFYEENREKFELNTCDRTNFVYTSISNFICQYIPTTNNYSRNQCFRFHHIEVVKTDLLGPFG